MTRPAFDALDLSWVPAGEGADLFVLGNGTPVARVERDGLGWRCIWPDGRQSDLMAISAAKDFAASMVLAAAYQRER